MAKRPRFGFGPLMPVDPVAEERVEVAEYKPGLMEMFDAVAGGQTITDARKGLMAEHQAQRDRATQRQQMAALMEQVLTNPRERLAFLSNQPEWAKSVSTNVAAANTEGGATRNRPGFENFSAPKVFEAGDSIISAVPGESMEVLGKRDPSYAERSKVEIAEKLADIREMLAGSKMARDGALTAQGNARIGIARQKAAGAGARPASRRLNTGRILGSSLPEDY